ncbi:hypothetical protein EYR36_005275 [Pleurotus pulmonarius]|nr:hypothetical protein EYR36_005275 [Pleurotus pulmonarius]
MISPIRFAPRRLALNSWPCYLQANGPRIPSLSPHHDPRPAPIRSVEMGIFTKRWATAPSTPKIKSISLPDDNDMPTLASRHTSDKIAAPPPPYSKSGVESRPSTPLSGIFRTRRNSLLKGSSKTVSASYEAYVTLPAKQHVSGSLERPTANKSSEGGSLAREHRLPMAGSSNVTGGRLPESRLKPKVVHDSWVLQSGYNTGTQTIVFPSSSKPLDGDLSLGDTMQARSTMGKVPSKSYPPSKMVDHIPTDEYTRRRHHSSAGKSYSPPTCVPSRRAETPGPGTRTTTVKKVPAKAESIALSWPLLKYNPARRRPLLYFDIAFDPDIPGNIRARKYGEGVFMNLTPAEQEMSICTHDVVTDMHIVYPKLPTWPVHVHRLDGIRCIDVFEAIYKVFNKRLRKEEAIPAEHIHAYRPAFEQRCRDSPCLTEYEKKQGMRRVDVLRGTRMFSGLTQAKDGRWVLELAHPTGGH